MWKDGLWTKKHCCNLEQAPALAEPGKRGIVITPWQTAAMTPTQPGKYWHSDPIGGPPQLVQVDEVEGELVAVFAPVPGVDKPGAVPVADMAGTFMPAL